MAQVELAGDHAGKLGEPAAEAVFGGPGVTLHQGMALQGAEQPQGGRAMNAEITRHLSAGKPREIGVASRFAAGRRGEQVEDGDRPIHGADHIGFPSVVAHCATLYDRGILVGL